MGLTGGYLAGYLPGVLVAGLVSRSGAIKVWKNALASVLCMAIVYLFGVIRLKFVIDASWTKANRRGAPSLPSRRRGENRPGGGALSPDRSPARGVDPLRSPAWMKPSR